MAVYTHLSADQIAQHLARYDVGTLQSHSGISEGVENTNYKITTDKGVYILTLFEKRVDEKSLPFYLHFMEELAREGLPVATIEKTLEGNDVASVNGKPAIITRFLQGHWPQQPSPDHCAALGRTLAIMHKTGAKIKKRRHNTLDLAAWRALISACGPDKTDSLQAGLYAELSEALDLVEKQLPKGLPSGVVHADLFPDNVFFDDHGHLSGVIDFYFACTETFVYDLMLTINAWCFTPMGTIDAARAAALLDSYRSLRLLSAAEESALPLFGMAAALRIVATRLYDFLHPVDGALVRAKDPIEHLRILHHHRHEYASHAPR